MSLCLHSGAKIVDLEHLNESITPEATATWTPTTAKKLSNGSCRPDRERGGLRVGRKFLPLSDVLETVAELRGTGVETVVDTPVSVPVKLTHDEHRMLKVRAAQSGCSISDLVRRALYAAGVATQYTAIT
jgi:hypothetical protein